MRVRHVLLSLVTCLDGPHFATLCAKQHNFLKKKPFNITYVLISSTMFVWNISHSKNNSARYHYACARSCIRVTYSMFLSDANNIWIFSTDFRKKYTQTKNVIKIRPVGAELFHANGWTDRKKPIVAFRNWPVMTLDNSGMVTWITCQIGSEMNSCHIWNCELSSNTG